MTISWSCLNSAAIRLFAARMAGRQAGWMHACMNGYLQPSSPKDQINHIQTTHPALLCGIGLPDERHGKGNGAFGCIVYTYCISSKRESRQAGR
jgi:hypothetical protein